MKQLLATMWIALWFFASCTTMPPVDQSFDPGTDFSALRKYAWAPSKGPQLNDERIDEALLDRRIKQAANASMSAKGFSEVSPVEADFLVGYVVRLEDRTIHFESLPRRLGDHPVDLEYEVGTLTIVFADSRNEKVIWQGSLQSEVDVKEPGVRTERAVTRILKGFPPGK